MRTQSKACLVFVVTLVAAVVGICSVNAETPSSFKTLNLEKSQDQVRVIMLGARPEILAGVSHSFVIAYAVEVPAKGAFSDLHFRTDGISLSAHGTPLKLNNIAMHSMNPKDLQNGIIQPVAREGRRIIVEEVVLKGTEVAAPSVDVKLQFSWRSNKMSFDFKDVSLN